MSKVSDQVAAIVEELRRSWLELLKHNEAAAGGATDVEAEIQRLDSIQERLARQIRSSDEEDAGGRLYRESSEAGREGGELEDSAMEDFWREETLEELVEKQHIRPIASLDQIAGRGAGLWEDDDDFERFVQGILDRRAPAG